MDNKYEFVHVMLFEDGAGIPFVAVSPCGSVAEGSYARIEGGALLRVKECHFVDRCSAEFLLLEKVTKLLNVTAVYDLYWERTEAEDGESM